MTSRFARFALYFAVSTIFLSLAALGAKADSGTTYTYASQDYTTWNTFVPWDAKSSIVPNHRCRSVSGAEFFCGRDTPRTTCKASELVRT